MQKTIWQSRTFWATVVDVVVSLVVYFVTKYAAPTVTTDVLFVIGLLQPVVIAYVVGKNYQDAHIIPTQINAAVEAEMNKAAEAFAMSPEVNRYFAEQDAQHDQGAG